MAVFVDHLQHQSVVNMQKAYEAIRRIYGEYFTDKVGVNRIYALPEMVSGTMSNDWTQLVRVVPSMLGEHSAVRGITATGQPFIAIKITLEDQTTQKTHTVVEVIFKGRVIYEDMYSAKQYISSEEGERFPSCLFSDRAGMTDAQILALGALLDGKKIHAPTNVLYRIQKV